MNAIAPRPATSDEAEAICELIYVPKADLDRISREQQAEAARIRRRNRLQGQWKNAALALLAFGLVSDKALDWFGPPRERIHTTVAYVREDGTSTHFVEWSALPENVREDTTVNALWGYVQARESWSAGSAPWVRTHVAAMSEPKLRDAWLTYFDDKGRDGPSWEYRDGTSVEARYVNWAYACPTCAPEDRNAYVFWWDRYEWKPGSPQGVLRGRWSTTVQIKRDVPLPQDRLWQRWTFNAPQVQVVGYDRPRRDGIAR